MSEENAPPAVTTVKLVSRDDVEYDLPLPAATLSRFVCNSLSLENETDTLPDDCDESDLKVDVMRVSGECLGKVVDFLKHHKDEAMGEITMPLPGPTFEDVSYNDFILGRVACCGNSRKVFVLFV